MATYKFRCAEHGDFLESQPMDETVLDSPCPERITTDDGWEADCRMTSPKVMSSHLHYTYGRDEFKNGVDGTGETVRETAERWKAQHIAEGRDPVPVGRGY